MAINTTRWNRLRYTLYAPVYDLVARRLAKGRRRAHEVVAVRDGERVLIVGAGTGLDLELLPRAASITAIDLTPAMVERLKARAATLGLHVRADVMDAEKLAFPDAAFDVVMLHLILAIVPDPVACAREAARVLRPRGRISIFDKFLQDGGRASLFRRAANVLADAIASNINRQLGPILEAAGIERVHEEPAGFGGVLRVALARKVRT